MPPVAIIVINYNNWTDTLECLRSIISGSVNPYLLVLIDNGSYEGQYESLVTHLPEACADFTFFTSVEELSGRIDSHMVFLRLPQNLGFAAANNIGLKYALERTPCDLFWLLNNDCIIDREALLHLTNKAMENENIGAVGSKLLFFSQPNLIQAAGGGKIIPCKGRAVLYGYGEEDKGQWNKDLELDYIMGASLMVKRNAIEKVGLMEERYFLYWEESDWCVRMRRKGFTLGYAWQSKVFHKQNPFASPKISADYYISRNTPIFLKRNFPECFLSGTFFSYLGRLSKRLWRFQLKNALAVHKGYMEGIRIARNASP